MSYAASHHDGYTCTHEPRRTKGLAVTDEHVMTLGPDEPAAGLWRAVALEELIACIRRAAGAPRGRPAVVAIDGRGGAGKSTLAQRLHVAVTPSAVVHTDDVAWHHSFFGWHELLAQGVLQPTREGRPVSYRPPAWQERGRAGAVEVPAGLDLLFVEGTGAGRRELSHLVDAVVWVQSDLHEAKRRALARDVAEGTAPGAAQAEAFWHEWMAEEIPFLAEQRPWDRACCMTAGTHVLDHAPHQVVVASGPGG